MFYFPFKNNFFLRETRDGLGAFSGADLSRARFLTRSSKTLDREHRWNNAGFEKARVEWGKKWKEKRLRLRTPNWSGPSEISHRAWFSPEDYKQLYTATRQRVREPEKKDFNWGAEHLHDFVLFAVNSGLRPDEAWRLEFRDVTIVDDEDLGKTILEIDVSGKRGIGYCKSMPGAVRSFERLRKRASPGAH